MIWNSKAYNTTKTLPKFCTHSSHIILLCYDISNLSTFQNLDSWVNEIENYSLDSLVVLIGNKSDCKSKRQVSYEEGLQFANEHNFLFFETSSKDDINVAHTFESGLKNYIETNDVNNTLYL